VALNATLYNFEVDLSDTDRHVYETLSIRVARHPSESEEYLVARLLAYLLEYADGIEFSRGVSDADEPAIVIRDLTGTLTTWVDIGTPDAARLHKASKAARRVAESRFSLKRMVADYIALYEHSLAAAGIPLPSGAQALAVR